MASANPTRTITIERNWEREVNRRWREFTASILDELERRNDLVVNKDLGLDQTQASAYMDFVRDEIDRLLLETAEPPNWQAKYQLQAYERSLERFGAQLTSTLTPLQAQQAASIAGQITAFTATPSLGIQAALPIHRDALEFLFTRSYDSLKGWTDALAKETRQILFDAVAEGKSVRDTAAAIRERTGVSRSRAKVIAQTETNQAFGQAQINEAEAASEAIGEEVGLRWLSARDSRVRHLHARWHGQIFTPKEARRRKGVSPWNCRCGLAPVIQGTDTEVKKQKFSKERSELLELERSST